MFKSIRDQWFVAGVAILVARHAELMAKDHSKFTGQSRTFWEALGKHVASDSVESAPIGLLNLPYPNKHVAAYFAASRLLAADVRREILAQQGLENADNDLFIVAYDLVLEFHNSCEQTGVNYKNYTEGFLFAAARDVMLEARKKIVANLRAKKIA